MAVVHSQLIQFGEWRTLRLAAGPEKNPRRVGSLRSELLKLKECTRYFLTWSERLLPRLHSRGKCLSRFKSVSSGGITRVRPPRRPTRPPLPYGTELPFHPQARYPRHARGPLARHLAAGAARAWRAAVRARALLHATMLVVTTKDSESRVLTPPQRFTSILWRHHQV